MSLGKEVLNLSCSVSFNIVRLKPPPQKKKKRKEKESLLSLIDAQSKVFLLLLDNAEKLRLDI